jgi:hypothetical protein
MRPQIKFRLSGRFDGLKENVRYSVYELSKASGIKLETLRERLARRHTRDIVMPSDLAQIGFYRKVSVLLETESEAISQEWLAKPLADQNLINWLLSEAASFKKCDHKTLRKDCT